MEKASRRDSYLFLICFILLCVEVVLLLQQLRVIPFEMPWELGRKAQNTIGEVIHKKQILKERSADSLSWYPLAAGDKIEADSLVMTGEGSTARIKIEGEGEIQLGPSTFLSFGVDRSNPKKSVLELEVDQGAIRLTSHKEPVVVRVKDKKVELKEDTEVILSREVAAKSSKIEVSKGELSVQPAAPPQDNSPAPEVLKVTQGEAIKLSLVPEKTESAPTESTLPERVVAMKVEAWVPPQLKSPRLEEHFFFQESEQTIPFRWKGEGAERLEISESPAFENSKKIAVLGSEAQLPLSPGEYYWRLGKGEQFSTFSHFIAMPPIQYALLSPPMNSTHLSTQKIKLKWQPISQAKNYRFQLSRDENFQEIVLEKKLPSPEETLKGLEVGHYYWRIKAEHEKWGEWPYSKTHSFSIKSQLTPPKPKGIKRLKKSESHPLWEKTFSWLENLMLPSAFADEEKVNFLVEWEPTKGAVSYLFEISQNESFQTLLFSQEVTETSIPLELSKFEKYFWRVAGRDKEGTLGFFSSPQLVLLSEVQEPPPPPPPPPQPEKKVEPVVPKKIVVIKKPRPPSYRGMDSLVMGFLGSYLNQTSTGDGIKVEQSGTPLGQGELQMGWKWDDMPFQLSGWYSPKKFTSKNTLPTDIQTSLFYQKQFGGKFLFGFPDSDWWAGLRFDRSSQFERTTIESVQIKDLNLLSLVIGPVWKWGSTKYLRTSALFEITPLIDAKGAALDARIDLGYSHFFGLFTPELNFGLRPSYYVLSLHSQKVFTIQGFFGLSLRYEWGKS